MLTRQQRTLLVFIRDYIKREKVAPTYEEMKAAFGLQSKQGIHRLIQCLIERGYVKTIPGCARALKILRGPDDENDGFRLTPDEFKVIDYLRSHKDVLAQILERCE